MVGTTTDEDGGAGSGLDRGVELRVARTRDLVADRDGDGIPRSVF